MKRIRKFLDEKGHYIFLTSALLSLCIQDYTMFSLMISLFLLDITSKLDS